MQSCFGQDFLWHLKSCDFQAMSDWVTWALQLQATSRRDTKERRQAGDVLWYQRCEGGHVRARVVDVCVDSNSCWVEYHVHRPQGLELPSCAFEEGSEVDSSTGGLW